LYIKRTVSVVKRAEFVSDRMSYVMLTGNLCDTLVLNVHVPTEGKTDVTKGRLYEELERVFSQFPKHRVKSLSHILKPN
jgi:hypothetical protein